MENGDFENYFDLDGNEIFVEGTNASDTSTSNYQSEDIPYLINTNSVENTNTFISKNAARAVPMDREGDSQNTLINFSKVPASRIYFYTDDSIDMNIKWNGTEHYIDLNNLSLTLENLL